MNIKSERMNKENSVVLKCCLLSVFEEQKVRGCSFHFKQCFTALNHRRVTQSLCDLRKCQQCALALNQAKCWGYSLYQTLFGCSSSLCLLFTCHAAQMSSSDGSAYSSEVKIHTVRASCLKIRALICDIGLIITTVHVLWMLPV